MRKSAWAVAALCAVLIVPAAVLLADFVNGGFETGDFTGWTKSSYLNTGGLSGTPPYSGASITRAAGGDTNESVIVTAAAPETGVDAQLGAGATLRFPKYGTFSARVNSNVPNYHSNSIVQQATMSAADVDPSDGLVHIRFAFAPVLENPGHAAAQQPYFYVGVRNVTKSNALLYESLNFSNESGIPWKTSNGYLYTDWRIGDIAPGNASLAVGDVVEIEVIGAGCSQSGHFGYVYVDAFGRDLPGLTVQKVADRTLVAPGDTLTYTFTYRNGGAADANGVIVRETVPAQTTFASVSDTTNCSEAGGAVTCNFGTLGAGASGTFQVTVTVNAGATGFINNGTYSIEATGINPTIGPLVSVPVTGPSTDIAIVKSVSPLIVDPAGGNATYTLDVDNLGVNQAQNVVVTDNLPAGVTLVSATPSQGVCTGVSTITCNLGNIAAAAGAAVTIVVTPTVLGAISNTATVSGSFTDLDPTNNTSTVSFNNGSPDTDVAITKTASPAVIDPPGGDLTWTVTVTNNGPADAAGVTVTDVLPADAALVSATPDQGTCSGTSTISCALGTVANGATATVTIVVQPTRTGRILNTASVAGNYTDLDPSNDVATAAADNGVLPVPVLGLPGLVVLASLLASVGAFFVMRRV